MRSGALLVTVLICGLSFARADPVFACIVIAPPPPPMRSVPTDVASTIRVRVQAISRGRVYGAPVMATVRVLNVYRGAKLKWTDGKLALQLPLCRPASVNVEPGADLVIYGPRPFQQLDTVVTWTSHLGARRFDPLVR